VVVRGAAVLRRGGSRWGEPAEAPGQAALHHAGGVGHPALAAVAIGGSTWNIQAAAAAATRTESVVLGKYGVLWRRFGQACAPATAAPRR
jgi:hypothetical protein